MKQKRQTPVVGDTILLERPNGESIYCKVTIVGDFDLAWWQVELSDGTHLNIPSYPMIKIFKDGTSSTIPVDLEETGFEQWEYKGIFDKCETKQ